MGHSLGGLYVRYCVGLMEEHGFWAKFGVTAQCFVTVASPHLGIRTLMNVSAIRGKGLIGWIGSVARALPTGFTKGLAFLADGVVTAMGETTSYVSLFLSFSCSSRSGYLHLQLIETFLCFVCFSFFLSGNCVLRTRGRSCCTCPSLTVTLGGVSSGSSGTIWCQTKLRRSRSPTFPPPSPWTLTVWAPPWYRPLSIRTLGTRSSWPTSPQWQPLLQQTVLSQSSPRMTQS